MFGKPIIAISLQGELIEVHFKQPEKDALEEAQDCRDVIPYKVEKIQNEVTESEFRITRIVYNCNNPREIE